VCHVYYEYLQLYEVDDLLHFLPIIPQPIKQNLIKNEVQLLEESIPMNKTEHLHIINGLVLESDKTRDRSKTVDEEKSFEVGYCILFEVGVGDALRDFERSCNDFECEEDVYEEFEATDVEVEVGPH